MFELIERKYEINSSIGVMYVDVNKIDFNVTMQIMILFQNL